MELVEPAIRPRNVRSIVARKPVHSVTTIAVLILCSCTGHQSHTPSPQSVCRAHLKHVVLAANDTVRGVAGGGPRPVSAPPPRLGTYGPTAPVTLCLVPGNGGEFNAVAITPDGQTHLVWIQGDRTRFMPPI